ncbi:tRNA pseudouridine(38-40) synthase TruA [Acidihalobacter yilgarnensis]|uniref:tRNA pseudouridine synthase A n=1 Tax=Acidihalobacter yilgarnensis TaxID=2819280 RepID=A0A1D8ILZ3_9GAMM|nr:tRNA pseudouridine(38-40) synthase TruA [Acidihalobacter yilgarnensis]AOU97486.1 tRNA pseudouridine(38-40) synthase TruA [Acidihalobacter yilgarnensis]
MRIALGIEYDGRGFSGWQRQTGTRTVQECLEKALSKVADAPVNLVCAGRTDAGVHAVGQVAHFDAQVLRSLRSWVLGANANLPGEISVQWASEVDETFHARFSALSRRYRYVILNRWVRPGLLRGKVTWQHAPLDLTPMREAASHLVGRHDFSSYRALACQAKSPIRTVHSIVLTREDDCLYLDIHANAFLHHMVRNIAGVLIAIGKGEQTADWSREILEYRDRTRGGVTAPGDGLYFVHAEYPDVYSLPQPSRPPRF